MKGSLPEKRIALFASGNGTNVQRICEFFQGNDHIRPVALFCDRPGAFVLERAERLHLPSFLISRKQLSDPGFMLPALEKAGTTHIVLAGFLSLVPGFILRAYPGKILNIHPSLLPKFGGKGMYGMHVHEAVVAAKEPKSGITVHVVDERYDTGPVIFQAECALSPEDDAQAVAEKIHKLEQAYFPEVIRKWADTGR